MLIHYLTVAIRNFRKDKGYSLINLIGLSLAVACCFLFLLWVQYEKNYESSHKNRDNIYRVASIWKQDGELMRSAELPGLLGRALVEEFPAIINSTFFYTYRSPAVLLYNEEPFNVLKSETDKHFFELFTFEFLQGSPATAFEGQNPIIISEELAKKIFGNDINNVVGQQVRPQYHPPHIITAVVRIPDNTHIRFDVLIEAKKSSGWLDAYKDWTRSMYTTFVQIDPQANLSRVAKIQMADYLKKQLPDDKRKLFIEPLKDIHLHSLVDDQNLLGDMGEPRYIYIFLTTVLFVLIIAIINYVNLSIARGATRSREVGVRKVAGAYRWQLILQFFFEAFIWSLVAMLVAFALSEIFVKWFSNVMETPLKVAYNFRTLFTMFGLSIFVALLSGGYSAFYLSSFSPSITLKGGTSTGSKSLLRKRLLGIQLTLSAFILLCTCIVYKQLNYIQTKDPGFDRFNVIHVSTGYWYDIGDFKKEVLKKTNVEAVSIAYQSPFETKMGGYIDWERKAPDTETKVNMFYADWDYAKVFKLQLLEGDFLPENMTWWQYTNEESFSTIMNEAAAKIIGKQNIIGTKVNTTGMSVDGNGNVVGVVKDFNFRTFHKKVTPLIIRYNPEAANDVFIRISPNNQKETLSYIQNIFMELRQDRPFEYSFVEDKYMAMYRKEFRMGKIFLYFSLLSIFISCMGVFSLVALMVEQRSKEISVRKINGAGVYDIIMLFIREFSIIICLSFMVAALFALFFMNNWLMDYHFRTNIGIIVFIGVLVLIWTLCMLTLFVQVYKAARRNPVESLKYE